MEKKIFLLTSFLAGLVFLPAWGQTNFDKKLKSLYKNTVPVIQAEELSHKIEGNAKIILLDTRSPKEFNVSHLPNALFLDYDNFNSKKVEQLDRNTKVIVYCSVGYRSERIGEKLLKMGFKDVKNLYGGIFDWVNKGNTVVNQSGVATDSVHTYNKDWSQWLNRGVKVY